MATQAHLPISRSRPGRFRLHTRIFATAILLAGGAAAASPRLYEGSDILELELEAPISTLLRGRHRDIEVEGALHLDDGRSVPVRVETFGKSRLQECDFPPLKLKVERDAARHTPFEGQSTLRLVTHCRSRPNLERHMVLEYLTYRSYSLLAEPALRVRLARIRYEDTDGRRNDEIHHGFFVEEIDLAAERYGKSWLEIENHRVSDLDAVQATVFTLFQYLIGNTDYSAVRASDGERCCHNVALLGEGESGPHLLLPYDFDQTGLVNPPYAAPNRKLRLRSVRQRLYRGYCVHNDEVPAAIEIFNRRRAELEALFNDDSLPEPQARHAAWKYVSDFYDDIDDPKKLEVKILRRCRRP